MSQPDANYLHLEERETEVRERNNDGDVFEVVSTVHEDRFMSFKLPSDWSIDTLSWPLIGLKLQVVQIVSHLLFSCLKLP